MTQGELVARLAKFFGGPFKKAGEVRTKGRTLTLYEGGGGRKALVARRTIYRRGKPVATIVTGWKAI